jgi:diguanylate cyclase (GGDEF)-like protein
MAHTPLEQQYPARLLSIASLLTALMMAWLGWNAFNSYQVTKTMRNRVFRVEELRGTILYLDEVLTMSARMAAAANDLRWELRYREYEPQLSQAIEEAKRLSAGARLDEEAAKAQLASAQLVRMENNAFNLVRLGRLSEAQALLAGKDYEDQKYRYAQALAAFVGALRTETNAALESEQKKSFANLGVVLAVAPVLAIAWTMTLRTLRNWRDALSENNRLLSTQTAELADLNRTLDQRVADRTLELETARTEALRAKDDTERSNAELVKEMTERQRTEEALLESETTLRGFYNTSPMMMGIVEVEGDTILPISDNGVMASYLGHDRAPAGNGDAPSSASSRSLATAWIEQFQRSARTGRPVRFEQPYENGRGSQWLSVTVCEIAKTRNGSSRFSYVAEEVTERKRTEQNLKDTGARLSVWVGELEKRDRETGVLRELIGLLQACQTPEEGYEVLGKFVPRLFPGTSGGLSILRASKDVLETVVVWGRATPEDPIFAPDDCWALRRGQAYRVENPAEGVLCRHVARSTEGYACTPMMASGDTLGILHLKDCDEWAAVDDDEQKRLRESQTRLVVTVVEHIAPALANLRLREGLRTQSIRDPITGLFNRRYMEESMERELHRAERNGVPVTVIMLDLDHFKQFNDTFGHAAGDALLRELGQYLKQAVRAEDIACRYGGEEFTLILSGAPRESALQRAEAIREGARQLGAQHRGMSVGGVTISMGVSFFPEHGRTAEALLHAADEALYAAKAAGRNRLLVARTAAPHEAAAGSPT